MTTQTANDAVADPAGGLGRLALSTMYFQRWMDASDLRPFFAEGERIGFDRFELSHILAPEAVAGVDPDAVRISAVHHPCPVSHAYGAGSRITAGDAGARHAAAEQIGRTLETASRLRASAVVLHLGYVEDPPGEPVWRARFEVESRYKAGRRGTPEYEQALQRLRDLLTDLEPAHIDRASAMLPPLAERARAYGIRIGIETGYHASDLPSPAGMRRLLEAAPATSLGAWLDTGHVGAQENLGLATFADWFDSVGDSWVGVHFHDVVGLRDHLVPGTGGLPFAEIGRRLPSQAVRTCEFDWYFSPEEVRAGADHLVRSHCA